MKPQTPMRPSFRVGPYTVDSHVEEVKEGIILIPLTSTAFQVFYQLVEHRGDVVLREDFEPWHSEEHFGRLPLDVYISELRKQLGESIIKTVHGKGYRLSPEFGVETIPSPSLSKLDQLITIALDQIKAHLSSSFIATIKTCEVLRRAGQVAEAYPPMLLAYINLGHVGFSRRGSAPHC